MKALGIEDFGIYTVVGGVIVLLGFINSSMSIASSRFLTMAIGREDEKEIQRVYNASLVIHLTIALLVLVLGESLGLWIVNSYLNIDPNRLLAANMLYQFSVGAAIMSFIQVPFVAMLMSDERMGVYAWIDITNNMLKLAAAVIIGLFYVDRLILYGLLLFIVSVVVLALYFFYCRIRYARFKLRLLWDWQVIKPMLSFSGWDLLGCGGVALQSQGRQILINRFFTVALNAANGIALTVGSALSVFTNNVVLAYRPRIIKHYSVGDYKTMSSLTEDAMLFVLLLMSIVFVPLFINMDFVLGVWLGDAPNLTTPLCKMTLLVAFLEVINTVVKIGIHASGRMKWFTIISFIVNCIMVVITFLLFSIGKDVLYAYYIAFILTLINVIYNYCLLHRFVPSLNIIRIVKNNVIGVLICVICYFICKYIDRQMQVNPWIEFFVIAIVNGFLVLLFAALLFKNQIRILIQRRMV